MHSTFYKMGFERKTPSMLMKKLTKTCRGSVYRNADLNNIKNCNFVQTEDLLLKAVLIWLFSLIALIKLCANTIALKFQLFQYYSNRKNKWTK